MKELVTGKEIRQADLTEKITIFESYGVLGGADAADVLNTLLNKKSFFSANVSPRRSERRRHGPWVRLGFPVARRPLRAAQGDVDAVVRTAVRQAIQGVEEVTE